MLLKKESINAGIIELYLNKVESLIVKPNTFSGLFHYGTIVIIGTRGERIVISSIDKPNELKHIALDAIDLAKKRTL